MRPAPWLLILVTVPAFAQAQFRAGDLTPARNLISNPSFEATPDSPVSFSIDSGERSISMSAEALHGKSALRLAVSPGAESAILHQDVPGCGNCRYELSAWVKTVGDQSGAAALALEAIGRDEAAIAREETAVPATASAWRQLALTLTAPQETELVRVVLSAEPGITLDVDAVRLQITAGPRDRSYGPHLRDLRATRTEATWAALHWAGPDGSYEVGYRPARWPRDAWMTADDVTALSHSLVALEPATTYEVRVRLQWPPHYDEQGQLVAAPVLPAEPVPLWLTTAAWQPRAVGLLRIWPMAPLYTMAGPASRPRLVAARDRLYLAQQYRGGVYLSKLPPSTLMAEWTYELVPPANGEPLLILEDVAVVGETLSILYRRGSDELVLQGFSLDTEEAEEPLVVPLGQPPARLSHAALATFRSQLWVLGLEQGDGGRRRGLLRLAPVSGGPVSATHAWYDAPVLLPGEPSLATFGDELMISFSDVLAEGGTPGYQPLHLVSFDGLKFSGLRKMKDVGRNREPQGIQLGPSFYVIYTSDAAYASYGGRYRDLVLSIVSPDRLGLATITLLNDGQFNLSPDIAALGGSLWTVHEKLEHAPGNVSDQPRSFGVFIGRIDFGEAPRE